MNLAVLHPFTLALLFLAALPLFTSLLHCQLYSWVPLIPRDPISQALACALRLLAIFAITALILGIAGLYRIEQTIERLGQGAHIVLLLDRSSSMDNTFAGKPPGGGEEKSRRRGSHAGC
jgi:mxaC protein